HEAEHAAVVLASDGTAGVRGFDHPTTQPDTRTPFAPPVRATAALRGGSPGRGRRRAGFLGLLGLVLHGRPAGGDQSLLSFSRIGAASRSTARSCGVRSFNRWVSHASLRRRSSLSSVDPASVTFTVTCRRSVGCGVRSTRPRSTNTALPRVIEGGCI